MKCEAESAHARIEQSCARSSTHAVPLVMSSSAWILCRNARRTVEPNGRADTKKPARHGDRLTRSTDIRATGTLV